MLAALAVRLAAAAAAVAGLANRCRPRRGHPDSRYGHGLRVYVPRCDRARANGGLQLPGHQDRRPGAAVAGRPDFPRDVVGEITLSDGTPLWFPAPIQRADGELDRANNYTLDSVWARVIGFNLVKNQEGVCSENNPPIIDTIDGRPVERVEIGEECSYQIETGGWFGFETPGYAYIAVQNIRVVDENPDGQAYVSSTDPYVASTDLISGVSLNPAGLQPIDEGWFDWRFNTSEAERIERADEWFRVGFTTRVLNKALNASDAPNEHGAISRNVLNSTFDATFFNRNTGQAEQYTLGPDTVGYPHEPIRRVDLTITEPHVEVVKEVCNESLYGVGPDCANWTTHTAEGDAYDSYIYRITARNRAEVNGLQSAPAYDLIVTSTLDSSDLLYVIPLEEDGLDNDGDGLIDGADTSEGTISDNVVLNGIPAVITFSYTHSSALRRLDPGEEVRLYYRVDPDERAAPMQQLTNTVTVSYDTLEGGDERPSGNQTVDPRPNGDIGGARVYQSEPAAAVLEILPLQTFPKMITRLSNTPLEATETQPAVIGEEIEYRLEADLPVAHLRDFRIEDTLPAGLSCTEAPVVDLSQPPYNAAGFRRPGGGAVPPVTPECNSDAVRWDFGDVVLTERPGGANLFRFPVTFIARVDNSDGNRVGHILSNGHPATDATLFYIDENNVAYALDYGQVDAVVAEPAVELTKTVAPAGHADAADVLTVTVTATNTGDANAYNLRVLDDLQDRNMTFIAGSVSGNAPNEAPDIVDLSGGDKYPLFVWNSDNPLPPGATYTFSYQLEVDLAVQPLEVLDSALEADWTSLPDQATALNSGGQIGADGSSTGMRIGALPNAGDPLNNYETSAADASVSVPPLALAKTDGTPDVVPTIGAHKRFTLEIRLPEGTNREVRVQDELNSGSVSYFLTRNADFDVSYSFEGIAHINGQTPSEAAFLDTTAVHDASDTIVWDIGEVVTEAENDIPTPGAIEPRIVITYYARVNNDLDTERGESVRNTATLTYRNGETAELETLTADTAPATVVEPLLAVTKEASLDGEPIGGPVHGGDVIEYRVTIPNNGDSTAWDVNIVDSLPPELELLGEPSAVIDGAPVADFNPTPATNADGYKVWGRDNGDESLAIPAGATLVLSYSARVNEASGNLSNTVWVDWTSLQGESVYERHGEGCPNVSAPNEYCVSDSVALNVVDTTGLEKFFVEDSYATDGSSADDAILRVGDTVVYRLALNLPGVATRDVRVEDVLPPGMAFEAVVSINGDTSPDYTPPPGSPFSHAPITAAQVPAEGETGTLVWDLGTIASDSEATFEILYRARVMEDAGIAHEPSLALDNTASLHYTQADGEPAPPEERLRDSAQITLLQPLLSAISKTERSGLTSPATVNIGGDPMLFRLEACNADGLAPAYSVAVTDELPPELDIATLSAPVVALDGVALDAADYVYTAPTERGGSMAFLLEVPVLPGQCLTIDYDIGFHLDIPANSSWANSATLDEYWSLPAASGQRYGPLGPASFVMQNMVDDPGAPAKARLSAEDATIGELVEYEISVPGAPVNAILHDLVISDVLDPRLELVSVTEVSGNDIDLIELDPTEPGEVRLGVAQLPAHQQAVVRLVARVVNDEQVNGGDFINNTAHYHFRYTAGGDQLFGGEASAEPVRIVEPELSVAKDVANLSQPGDAPVAGDILRYTVSLTAAGGAAGDDYSDAFDVSLFDSLSLGLAYVPGSATVDGGNTIGDPTIDGDGLTAEQSLTWTLADGTAAINVAEGSTVEVVYDVRVLDNVQPNQTLANSVSVQWTGLDGPSEHQRDGSGVPEWNDYYAGPVTATVVVEDLTTLRKTRLDDTFGSADADVRVGDFVDYELRLGLQEGTHEAVQITDTLPRGLIFDAVVSVDRFGEPATVSPEISGDPAAGPTTVSFDLGTVVNPGGGSADDNYLVIVYRARVLNEVHPWEDSLPLTNSADLQYSTATGPVELRDEATVNLVQPRLAVSKSALPAGGGTVVEAGEVVTYTVDIRNTGAAPAYDTVLEDVLPAGLRQGGVTTTGISLVDSTDGTTVATLPLLEPAYDADSGTAIWDFDSGVADAYTIPVGQALRVVYQVTADAGLGAGQTLTNSARVVHYYSFDSNAVPPGGAVEQRERYGPSDTASATLNTLTPSALQKANTQPTAAIGEPFRYRITVPAEPVNTALYDVRIQDDLTASAADLSFVAVTKVSGSADWTPENTGDATGVIIADPANGIDIPAGEQVVIELEVVLDDSATNVSGLRFRNTADYSYNAVKGDESSRVENPAHEGTTAEMTIVGPDTLRLLKTGPDIMRVGTADGFTIAVENTGSGPAWGVTVTGLLPEGMCEAAPADFVAHIEAADGTTVAALEPDTDYRVATPASRTVCCA
ncbi:hypothetical protein CAL65_17705 [Alkalilimnicola ehrlichii]|uniref:DUF11 domain-containing protein n=1 Tax=Alkalilimnicola ehrlichii TaxID=351052 RepID=A0A3E0WK93_9GAMM|nr:hypothetical protein CAL65_17705 [Alkalilimnicola ehrlichii]